MGNIESYQLRHKRLETQVSEVGYYSDSGRYRPGRGFSGRVLPLEGGALVPAIKSRGLRPQGSVTARTQNGADLREASLEEL